MITLDEARPAFTTPVQRVEGSVLADRLLIALLYIAILSSFFVFVQPAPYEYLMVLLGGACLWARVPLDRKILPLVVFLFIRDASGAVSVSEILHRDDSLRFLATSFYLGLTAIVFACIFAQDTMRRLATLRSAYVFSAIIATMLSVLGYFQLLPGLEIFTLNDRAVAGFKDPNVLGVFLILPFFLLIEGFVVDKMRLGNIIAAVIIFIGLLLAYSRAAWGSVALGLPMMLWLIFITQRSAETRKRIVIFVIVGVVIATVITALLLSIDVVNKMLTARFGLQSYDSGSVGSRFNLQANSLKEILAHPNGMGPWEFNNLYGMVSHNTFLGTMLNHGWIGGFSYLALVLTTLAVGLRSMLVRTPWQTVLIATYVTYFALTLEALVVDTDHWRHHYLLLGMVWGLSAATINEVRRRRTPPAYAVA
ncbi:MAG: O-antigen ligase family protein [Rhizobiales bacterium]|nr:O-antigen ligase family protein [Hyphomicrobiales bacterium]